LNFIYESPQNFDQCDSNKARLKTQLQVLIDKDKFHENYADHISQKYIKYIYEVVAE